MINHKYIRECLEYDENTGDFYWIKRPISHFKNIKASIAFNCRFPGKIISSHSHSGYKRTTITDSDGSHNKLYLHRLAWIYKYGYWPDSIDHINGDTSDNRIVNLRSVAHKQNLKNCKLSKRNTSGIYGVRFNAKINRWVSRIVVDGKEIHLGVSTTLLNASCLRKSAEIVYGFHKNHGAR